MKPLLCCGLSAILVKPARVLSLATVMLALVVTSAHANGTGSCPFLQELERERAKVETFAARFEQKKTVALFDEVKTSTGLLLYKTPYQMIWKYESPDKTQMRIDRESVSFYFPQLEQIEVYPMQPGQSGSYFFFAFEATADEVEKNFEVSEPEKRDKFTVLRLAPKTDPLASQLRSITLWLAEDYLPRKILITEVSGDTTEVTLTDVRTNELIPEKELVFDAPEGTAIIRSEAGAF